MIKIIKFNYKMFTSLIDTDKEILYILDDPSLLNVYRLNKNSKRMIINNSILKSRYIKYKMKQNEIFKWFKNQNTIRIYIKGIYLSIHEIKTLVPESKNITSNRGLIYSIHPFYAMSSLNILISKYEIFNIEKVGILKHVVCSADEGTLVTT